MIFRAPPESRAAWTMIWMAEAIWRRMIQIGRSKPGHADHHLERPIASRVSLAWIVVMAAVVAGVHRLEHVERLGAAALADDDPVGPHSQGVLDQVAGRDLALPLDVRRPGLHPDDVRLLEPQLGGVLDRRHPFVLGDEPREGVQQRRLAAARAAGDQHVDPRLDARREELDHLRRDRLASRSGPGTAAGRLPNRRIESRVPSSASGGMIALTRLPSGRRASTIGQVSSTRRPTRPTMRWTIWSRCRSSLNTIVGPAPAGPCARRRRILGPLTRMSVTGRVAHHGLEGARGRRSRRAPRRPGARARLGSAGRSSCRHSSSASRRTSLRSSSSSIAPIADRSIPAISFWCSSLL